MAQRQPSNEPSTDSRLSTVHNQPSRSNIFDHANVVGGPADGVTVHYDQRHGSTERNRSRSPATRVEEQAAVTAALLQSATALPKAIDAKRTVHLSSLSVAQIAHDVYARNIARALPPLVFPPFPTNAAKASAKAPAKASAKTSAEAPARASVKTSAKAPAKASAKTSSKAPTRA